MDALRNFTSTGKRIVLLSAVLLVLLSSIGLTIISPRLMIPDGYGNATRALHRLTGGNFFEPVYKKGGNLHVNLLTVAYLPKVLYLQWFHSGQGLEDVNRFYVIGRLLSIASALAAFYFVLKIALLLYGERAALFAGLILTLSMGFVYHAHFATEDILMTALVVASVYCLASFWNEKRTFDLYAGAFTAGLAISAKASAGLLIVPYGWTILQNNFVHSGPDAAALYRRQIDPRPFLKSTVGVGGFLVLGYVLTTPSILVLPVKSLRYIVLEAIFRWDYRPFGGAWPGLVTANYYLARSFGLPLYGLTVLGFFGSLITWYRREKPRGLTVLLLFLVPYLLIVFSWDALGEWVVLPALPFLAVLSGGFLQGLFKNRGFFRGTSVLVALVFIFSFYFTLSGVHKFRHDSRIEASEWFHRNLTPGTEVDAYSWAHYLPGFPDSARVLSTPVLNGPNRYWLVAMKRLAERKPSYLVLVSSQYDRYFRDPDAYPKMTRTFRRVLNEQTGYEIIKIFGPPVQTDYSLRTLLEKTVIPRAMHPINPTVVVLKRKPDNP